MMQSPHCVVLCVSPQETQLASAPELLNMLFNPIQQSLIVTSTLCLGHLSVILA